MKMKMDKWKTRQQYAGPVIALSVVWMCGLDVFMFMWLEPDGHVICRTEKREAQAEFRPRAWGPRDEIPTSAERGECVQYAATACRNSFARL